VKASQVGIIVTAVLGTGALIGQWIYLQESRPTVKSTSATAHISEQPFDADMASTVAQNYLTACGLPLPYEISDVAVAVGNFTWERFMTAQVRVDRVRKWSESLEDKRMAKVYGDLLFEYQRQLDEAKNELQNHSIKKQVEAYRAKEEDRRRRAKEIVVPAPPCDNDAMPNMPHSLGGR
jgi:hypothetical protein